jgi:hypothetical protein
VHFDLKNQLENAIDRYPINVCSEKGSVIHGSIYQDFLKNKLKPNHKLISLNINTDGAPIFNSTGYSLWPIFASILEYPPIIRQSFRHVLLLG